MVYNNKIVRDLDFVINSPDLLNSDKSVVDLYFKKSSKDIKTFLIDTDKNPEDLIHYLGDRDSYRLGRYFERLLNYYLEWNSNVEVVESSMQVFRGKITLGEMDFILKDLILNKYIHLETAVKFFAKKEGQASLSEYLCPNAQRNLKSKIDKTFNKQIKIVNLKETQELLIEKGISKIESKIYIKGYLFYREGDNSPEEELISLGANRKRWIYFDEISQLNKNHYFRIAPKIDWLSKDVFPLDVNLLSSKELNEQLTKHFSKLKQGLMIVEFTKTSNYFVEKDKYFVLDNSWPNIDKSHFDYKKLLK